MMRSTLWTMAHAGVLAIVGLAMTFPAHAGCGGGGVGYRSYGGARGGGCGGSCCGMGGMNMAGMNMGAMPAMNMPGMNMGGPGGSANAPQPVASYPQAAPQPVGASAGGTAARPAAAYYCPMHPQVVSATPGTCPICQMALRRR